MEENTRKANLQQSPGEKHIIDPEPVPPGIEPLPVPGDPLEIDRGLDEIEPIGDDDDGLGNTHEQPHPTTTPSAEYDGIRDGDREAFDEISGDDEADYPRTI